MMMAHESPPLPEHRPLGDDTVAALRAAVLQLWERPDDGDAALHAAFTRMAEEARARSLRAEEVIVAFKDILAGLPALQRGGRRLEASRFREQLVTHCIKAYYAP
jgi:hypothetical protein